MKGNEIRFISFQKRGLVGLLYLSTAVIMFLGIYFMAFSYLNHIEFTIVKAKVSGIILGVLVTYLGAKYYFMVSDLQEVLYQSQENFSWKNFKKAKKNK